MEVDTIKMSKKQMTLSEILDKHKEEILVLDRKGLSHRRIAERLRKHKIYVTAPTLHLWFKVNEVGRYHNRKMRDTAL